MNAIFDAFWRAAGYCLHPRVILWSLVPLVLAGGLVLGLGWFFWEPAVDAVRRTLEDWALVAALLQWLDSIGAQSFRSVIGPLVVVALAVPVVVVLSLLLVAWLMTPALVKLVETRRFPGLERRGGAGAWWLGLAWSLGYATLALVLLVLSIPLWFIPPLALVLPPLIWGWLASRVLAFDTLSLHATPSERRLLMHVHRWPLLAMGIGAGLLGSAPSLVWAFGAMALVLAPVVALASIWLYTLVFAFGSLWFAHFLLARLNALRAAVPPVAARPVSPADVIDLPPPPAAPPLPPGDPTP